MNTIKILIVSLFLVIFQLSAFAAPAITSSPNGSWITIDDKTGKVKSVVKISGSPSNISGTVVKLFPGALTICSACSGKLKDKPILGMTIMNGLKQNPDNLYEWSGGTVLDPKTGQVYNCTITVAHDGRSLEIRGYVGISLFGRSQTWIRTPK